MNKTIYMTYKKQIPDSVLNRWLKLNPGYTIEFSLDEDCYQFLKTNFNVYVAELFNTIPVGMYKADLWRICKLYIHGGVYADVDLVPYINLDNYIGNTFITCLSIWENSMFQAFIMTPAKNPLVLCFILSFLQNNPFYTFNAPCYDMYNCIRYNSYVHPFRNYSLSEIKIPIIIPPSENEVHINLFYFPPIKYKCLMNSTIKFKTYIRNAILTVKRLDGNGWKKSYVCDIIVPTDSNLYLLQEKQVKDTYHVFDKQIKLLDSRDENYVKNKGW